MASHRGNFFQNDGSGLRFHRNLIPSTPPLERLERNALGLYRYLAGALRPASGSRSHPTGRSSEMRLQSASWDLQPMTKALAGPKVRSMLFADCDTVAATRVAVDVCLALPNRERAKTTGSTRSPRNKAAVISSKIRPTIASIWRRVRRGAVFHTRSTRSVLFIAIHVRFYFRSATVPRR